jgi:4-amino-4-deoxy-L-arabinose transferase-like glycosyltransferase
MDGETQAAARPWWRERELYCLILVVLAAHFFRLNELTIRGEESRRFTIGWEMVQSGDWIVPRVQGEPVFYRPPLQNWLLGLSAWLCGTCDAWAVRLPGALAVLATALLLYFYCRRSLSPLGAFTAGASFATMAQVLELGRLAETEALFTLLVSASLLVWHWGYSAGWPDARMWIAAYSLAGLGMLAKGSQAPIYLAASTGVFLLWKRQWRRLFSLSHLAGLASFALVFGAWWVPYALKMGPALGWRIIVGDTSVHVYSPNEYFEHLWQFPLETLSCMLPWSVLLPSYLSGALRRALGQAQSMVVFLATCLVVTFPSCWLVAGGATRYWMPLYPCVAALIGVVIQRGFESPALPRLRLCCLAFVTWFGVLMIAAAVMAIVASWPGTNANRFRQPWSYALCYGLSAGTLGCLVLAWQPRRRAGALFPILASAFCLALTNSIWILNYQDAKSYDLVAEVNRLKHILPPDAKLVSFGQVYHRFAYYYGRPIDSVRWPARPDDLPGDLTYFCFDNDGTVKNLPFAWEKVTDVVCARFRNAEVSANVVVGKRINSH